MRLQISTKRAEKIAHHWDSDSTLFENMRSAGLKGNDRRSMHRYRRQAEEITGQKLDLNSPQAHQQIDCPSTLNLTDARKHKTFVVTSHTNDSPIVDAFWDSLQLFCESKSAQLLVVPLRYQNKTAMNAVADYQWDERIYPYAVTKDFHIHKHLVISGHKLNATTVNPLAGKQALSGIKSAVYGHPQVALQNVGTPKDELPKSMMTTGSCNKPVYSSSETGGKAAFNHSVAAVIVHLVGKRYFFTQLGFDGEGFQFLNEYWTPEGVENRHAEIVHGDIHAWYERKDVTKSKLRIIDRVKPTTQIFHDLHDQHIGSHHATIRERVEQALKGEVSIEKEVRLSIDYLERIGKGTKNLIVGSNHNDHLDQWHGSYKVERDPYNAKFHGWLSSQIYGTDRNCLQACFDEFGCKVHYEFISRNKRHSISGVDTSQHGDKGVNGARGSAQGFSMTMLKTMIGHGHSDGIFKGCWQVGTSADGMTYANGYSTWTLTDGVIYPNGKRALIRHINGKTIADYL